MPSFSLPAAIRRVTPSLGAPLLMAAALFAWTAPQTAAAEGGTAFDLGFTSIEGEDLPLARFAGKALLVVNTASFCGYTDQYADLQEIWRAYRDRGLVVLGVPSDDFDQEADSEAEIKRFCEVNFDVDFPLTERAHVRGPEAHPFFRLVAGQLGEDALPRWNFHKSLVTPDGAVAASWPSRVRPTSPEVVGAIERALPAGG